MSDVHSTGALRQQPEAVDHDRELLELAALAYWGDEIDDVCSVRWLEEDQAIGYTHGDNQDHNGIDQEFLWNPLDDDGDALRLAVQLRLNISFTRGLGLGHKDEYMQVSPATLGHLAEFGPLGEGAEETIRRAIVRAAAAIGSELRKAASGSHQEARSNEQGEST